MENKQIVNVSKNKKIDNKIFIAFMIFIAASLLYVLITNISDNYSFAKEYSRMATLDYIEYAMYFCYFISAIGFMYSICFIFSKKHSFRFFTEETEKSKKTLLFTLATASIIPIVCIVLVSLYASVFMITPITGQSMEPTIVNDEKVLVSYNDNMDHFDVVIFGISNKTNYAPSFLGNKKTYYIKRIIGIPGDTITWVNKELFINNEKVSETYFTEDYLSSISDYENFNGTFVYFENNVKKETMIIPDGYYFVMGDNRKKGCSIDSRALGLIHESNIIGVAKYHVENNKLIKIK